jgi:hypothetical protein
MSCYCSELLCGEWVYVAKCYVASCVVANCVVASCYVTNCMGIIFVPVNSFRLLYIFYVPANSEYLAGYYIFITSR